MAEPTTAPGLAPAARKRWRPRRPRRRTLLVSGAALVLIGLPVADVTSRQVVQRLTADRMQDQLHTAARPSVHLDGTPFLTQLLSGRLSRLRVDVVGATACKVRITHVDAVLTGVRRKSGGVAVSSVSGDGLLSYDDLSAAVAPLRIAAGEPGQVTVSGGLGPFGFTAAAAPRIEGSTLVVSPVSASTTTGFGSSSTDLSGLPPMRIQLRQIPDGLAVSLDPRPDGLAFTFAGHDVSLAAAGCAGG
ncbi:MAG TPA: DUF2993 domain-containing protein [Sporichthyaceae bacterium]|nr:DUF2993 domain-containing protein [Sporichthyaceae bacterium]